MDRHERSRKAAELSAHIKEKEAELDALLSGGEVTTTPSAPAKSRAPQTCGNCGQTGHTARTCTNPPKESINGQGHSGPVEATESTAPAE